MATLLTQIRGFIADDNLSTALEALDNMTGLDKEMKQELVLLRKRHTQNEKGQRRGVLDPAQYKLEDSRIAESLLKFLDEIPHKSGEDLILLEIQKRFQRIVGAGLLLTAHMKKEIGIEPNDVLATDEQIEQFCKLVGPKKQADLIIQFSPRIYANWMQFLEFIRQRTLDPHDELGKFVNQIPRDLLSFYFEVVDFPFLKEIEYYNKPGMPPASNADFKWVENNMKKYFNMLRRLNICITL